MARKKQVAKVIPKSRNLIALETCPNSRETRWKYDAIIFMPHSFKPLEFLLLLHDYDHGVNRFEQIDYIGDALMKWLIMLKKSSKKQNLKLFKSRLCFK
jgi:hypothetical protein